MVRHLPPKLVRLAVRWRGEGLTQEVISWRLGVPQGTVSKILKRYRETGQFVQRRRSGRPRISTPREDRVLTRMCLANRFLSATMLRSIWMRTIRRRCSIRTVQGRLLAARLRAHRPCRRPALTRRHRHTRRRWAEAHRNWQLGHWRHAVFFDESRFTLYMRDGRVRRVSSGQGKVREIPDLEKVREKSGNFVEGQGKNEYWEKPGKSQGICI